MLFSCVNHFECEFKSEPVILLGCAVWRTHMHVSVKILFCSLSCSSYAGVNELEIYSVDLQEPNQASCKLNEIYAKLNILLQD